MNNETSRGALRALLLSVAVGCGGSSGEEPAATGASSTTGEPPPSAADSTAGSSDSSTPSDSATGGGSSGSSDGDPPGSSGSDSGGAACLALPDDVSPYEIDYSPWRPAPSDDCSTFPAELTESLPSGCFARCESATSRALRECGDDFVCRDDAMLADPTEPATIDGEAFGCIDCYYFQFFSCQYIFCNEEANAADECFFGLDDPDDYLTECAEEEASLAQCLFVEQFQGYQRCYSIRVPHCFGITPVERTAL